MSWTFDDASPSHLDLIAPLFAEMGVEVTFFPTCSAIVFDPDGWRAAVDMGHEVANHTMTHIPAGPSTDRDEIEGCDTVVEEVLGVESATFAYPNGTVDEPYYTYTKANHLAARATVYPNPHIRATGVYDWHALPGIGLGEVWSTDADADAAFARQLDGFSAGVQERGWIIFIVHAIDEPGYARMPFDNLQTVIDAVAEHDIWEATFVDVATHMRMQQLWRSMVPEAIDGGWTYSWTPLDGMSDVPIRIAVPAGRLEQDGVEVPVVEGYAHIDARTGSFEWFES